MSEKLPDKIIPISTLRINRDKTKICKCHNRKFEIDTTNRIITCQECGAIIHPYDALLDIASHYEQFGREVDNLLTQRKQILDYKPHLLVMRELEKIYMGGRMLPCCPHCSRGIYAKELLIASTSKQYEDRRRLKEESNERD